MKQRIAQVVIDINHSKLDRVFDYLIPESLSGQIGVGMPVRVPFGKGNVIREGFVIGLTDKSDYDSLKEITEVISDKRTIDQTLISLAIWM
jgi:primosomal protein N' (replication factor Y)